MDRVEFLARVARGRQRGDVTIASATAGPLPGAGAPVTSPDDVVQRFAERASAAGAVVARVATRGEAEEAVERLVGERGWQRLVGPPGMSLFGETGGDPAEAEFGLEVADWAAAATGSVLTVSGPDADRRHSLLPPVTGLFVVEDRIVSTMGDVLRLLERAPGGLPSCCTFITGPSSTADIAGHHVVGAHGPVEVLIWVIAEPDGASSDPDNHPEVSAS